MTEPQRKMNTSSLEEKLQPLGVFYVGVLRNMKMGWRRFQENTWLLVQLSAKLTYLQFQASKFWCQCLEHELFMSFHCHINIYKMNTDIVVICDSSYRQINFKRIAYLRGLYFCGSDLLTLEVSKYINICKM